MNVHATLKMPAPGLYSIFGLVVASDLALPEASPLMRSAASASPPDVYVEVGAVPMNLPRGREAASWLSVRDTTCLMRIPNIGRFLVEDGRRIVVEKEQDVSDDDLRVFL